MNPSERFLANRESSVISRESSGEIPATVADETEIEYVVGNLRVIGTDTRSRMPRDRR